MKTLSEAMATKRINDNDISEKLHETVIGHVHQISLRLWYIHCANEEPYLHLCVSTVGVEQHPNTFYEKEFWEISDYTHLFLKYFKGGSL